MKGYSHCYLVVVFFSVIFLSCNEGDKNIEEASLKVCNCFSDYNEEDGETMSNTIKLLDSVGEEINIQLIPHEKLVTQMQKDCPEAAAQFVSLSK